MEGRWGSGLGMSFAPLAAAWGPRRGKRVSEGGVAILADHQAAPRCLCPSEPPQAGDGVRAVGRASQGGTASSRCSTQAEDPEAGVGPGAQLRPGTEELSPAASAGASRPSRGCVRGAA